MFYDKNNRIIKEVKPEQYNEELDDGLGRTYSYNIQGQVTDIDIHASRMLRIKERLNKALSENTGKSYEEICRDTERDNFFSAEEAVEYGLVDKVIDKKEMQNNK